MNRRDFNRILGAATMVPAGLAGWFVGRLRFGGSYDFGDLIRPPGGRLREPEHIVPGEDESAPLVGLIRPCTVYETRVTDNEVAGAHRNVDGVVTIRDLNRATGWNLPDEEAVTVAGLVIHEAQTIPAEKQAFTFHGKRFVVMKREKNRITKLRIRPV